MGVLIDKFMNALRDILVGFFSAYTSGLIIILFIISAICLILTIYFSGLVLKDIEKDSEKKFKASHFKGTVNSYNMFHTLVSTLPLLGMLGTVVALLKIDFGGEIEDIKSTFFLALDTTMFGLAGSIFLKLPYALFQTRIERAIDKLSVLEEQSIWNGDVNKKEDIAKERK